VGCSGIKEWPGEDLIIIADSHGHGAFRKYFTASDIVFKKLCFFNCLSQMATIDRLLEHLNLLRRYVRVLEFGSSTCCEARFPKLFPIF